MELFNTLALFALGFYILIKGASVLVNGAASIARTLGLSGWFVGMAVVGVGTSIPELSVSIASVWSGSPVGLGTIMGSNTFNIFFILGVAALFTTLSFKRTWISRDLSANVLASAAAVFMFAVPLMGVSGANVITRLEGAVLLLLFVAWGVTLFRNREAVDDLADYRVFTWSVSVLMIIGGLVGVFVGGKWVVDGAEVLAGLMGISSGLVGLTLVAIGTSLPELAVTLVALFKKQNAIAIGNIIGSNVFDFLAVWGIAALVRPLVLPSELWFDLSVALGAAVTLLLAVEYGKPRAITKTAGWFFIASYAVYFVFIVMRG